MKTGVWNKVMISRLNRLGMLTLNDDLPVKGQSAGEKKELNLPMKLFIGGYPRSQYTSQAGISSGFQGAIQRVRILFTIIFDICIHHHCFVLARVGRPSSTADVQNL